MKAKDLIVMLAELDPDEEIHVCSCSSSCMGGTCKDVELVRRNHTTWDHRSKSVAHNVITELQGVEN